MKKIKLIAIILAVLFAGVLIYYFTVPESTQTALSADELRLIEAGDRCAAIADKSVADKTAIVEFQKLEFASRRDNVLVRCMRDSGYAQSPAWLKYAEPVAKANTTQQNISFDEAITTLSRKEMQTFKVNGQTPLYWVELPASSSP